MVPYLQDRGYLTTSGAALDGITIEDASRRNTNLKVLCRRGTSYFLKQARDSDGAAHLAHEASIYRILLADARRDSVRRCVPRLIGYDPIAHVLVTELMAKSHDLREHHARQRRCPVALSMAVARALATVHRFPITSDLAPTGSPGPPWIFRLHRPGLRQWRGLSGASLKAIEIIQGSAEFCRLLDGLGQEWRSDTLIHFDARWDNCIVPDSSAPRYTTGLRIVDWELAGLGDACWDTGSVMADYLSLWRASVLLVDDQAAEQATGDGLRQLERIQPAMRAFWNTYVKCMRHEPALANELLVRTARFTAVRLLQTAVEATQISPEITSGIVGSLQLSLSMLQRPVETIAHLLGIRPTVSSR
ncbi:phosphotransferase [Catellatospora sp. NPDC049111]|uniref:phosphotransferase family protein n=1 Tax=Catellatospora sp. NPDC049111 TaxID=3155271 RepID=UPI0034102F4F